MGVKASPSSNRVVVEASEAPLHNGGTLGVDIAVPGRVLEKQSSLRRKGMEKSVLDDIMGDPDDFQDLADCDLPSESDGGRWEDAVRAALEDEAAAADIQGGTKKLEERAGGSSDHIFTKIQSAKKLKREADMSRSPSPSGGEGGTLQDRNGQHQHVDTGEDPSHLANGDTGEGVTKQQKRHHTRYFIIKSLNHHNIAKSIEKGIWATQAMNEPVLNEAFETSERVVLVFSVNMSSHFQGYARMTSPIGQLRANIWTEANEGANPWGGTFRVEWLRLYDLPFQKTVHLKNPLNAFKPVKISRDCQELTQSIGEALCALINEGDEQEGRSKRKLGSGVIAPQLGKRSREVAGEVQQKLLLHGAPTAGPLAAQVYTPHMTPSETYELRSINRPISGFSSKSLPMTDTRRSSKSRSPHPATSEKNERQRVREKDRGLDKEHTQSRSSTRSADLRVEEDLVNLTYEQYLQRHGHGHFQEYNGYHQGAGHLGYHNGGPGYGGWSVGGPSAAYSQEDAYSKYVASWYGQVPNNGMMHGVECEYGYGPPDTRWNGHYEEIGAVHKRHGMG